jgi:hypothetical protein
MKRVVYMRLVKWLFLGVLLRRFGWLGVAITAFGIGRRFLDDRKTKRSA